MILLFLSFFITVKQSLAFISCKVFIKVHSLIFEILLLTC